MNSKRDLAVTGSKSRVRLAVKSAALVAALLMAAIMAMPSPGRARAASATDPQLQAMFGDVVQVNLPDTLIVATDAGVETLIIPGNDAFTGDITSIEDISEGDRVVASAYATGEDVYTAQKVMIQADASTTVVKHILGVILDESDGSVSIQDNNGNTLTVLVPEGVTVPDVGTVVTVIVQVDSATGDVTARAFDSASDVVKRLQAAVDSATDATQKQELETQLENARDQHLTALEKARVALERARQAVDQGNADEVGRAQQRLNEVQATFNSLNQKYQADATAREERQPELRITGAIRYGETAWEQASGVFNLAIQPNDSVDNSAVKAFTWDSSTNAVVPIEVQPQDTDSSTSLQGSDVAPSQPVPLNSVKSLIPNGSQVIVQYDPNANPPRATLITLLPPELPDVLTAALKQEQLRNFSGVVTLVQETPDLDSVLGVVVVASGAGDQKVAAKVTADTTIEIDGQTSDLGSLAAGMAAEVEFNTVQQTDGQTVASSSDGRLDAKRIRARTVVDEKEAHIAGVISNLDSDSRSVTIKPIDGAEVTLQALDDAVIVKDGQPSRFGSLKEGDLVLDATRYNRETLALTRLVVQSPRLTTFSGSITGIDRNPDRVTVATADGDVMSVFIADATSISSETAGAIKFTDLSIGDRILKGSAQAVDRSGRTVNVAVDLLIGKPKIATARGVVRSVDPETGELVIVVSAANAADSSEITLTVPTDQRPSMFKNGEQIKTLASVMVGDIVESVAYNAESLEIQKLSVVSPNIQRVRGTVVSVNGDSLTMITVDGRDVALSVVDETQITLNGRAVQSLARVQPRDAVAQAVYIALTDDLARGVAVQLTITSASTSATGSGGSSANGSSVIETTVSGVLTDVDGQVWAIGDRRFQVTEDTQFFGAKPEVGLVAKATLQTRDGGALVAVAISVAGRPDTNPTTRPAEIRPADPADTGNSTVSGLVRILGRVQDLEKQKDGSLIIVIDGVKITTNSDTKVTGDPKAGVAAIAVVKRTDSGDVIAVAVIFGSGTDGSTGGDTGTGSSGTPTVTPTATPGSTASPTPTPTATPSETVTATPADTDVKEVKIVVEDVSGRLVLADGDLYLLTLSQSVGVEKGDTLTLNVRETAFSGLTAAQRTLLAVNLLYLANTDARIFVSV